jgi:hypothetical protein
MPDTTVFPMESYNDYEVLLRDHIKRWISTYLGIRERYKGLTPGSIARPRSWHIRQDFSVLPGYERTPAIVIVSPGTTEPPYKHGDGKFDVRLRFAIVAITHGPEALPARRLAGHYQAALAQLLVRQAKVGNARINDWLGFDLDDIDQDQERTLASCRLECVYIIKDFVDATGGPYAVPDDPLEPIPDEGVVEETNITIEKVE